MIPLILDQIPLCLQTSVTDCCRVWSWFNTRSSCAVMEHSSLCIFLFSFCEALWRLWLKYCRAVAHCTVLDQNNVGDCRFILLGKCQKKNWKEKHIFSENNGGGYLTQKIAQSGLNRSDTAFIWPIGSFSRLLLNFNSAPPQLLIKGTIVMPLGLWNKLLKSTRNTNISGIRQKLKRKCSMLEQDVKHEQLHSLCLLRYQTTR